MTDITAAELADMEERARGWLPLQGNRDLAINEERMALDVLDLIDAVRKLAASHETMRGVVEAAIAWSESFGELSKRLPPHVHALRDAVDAYEAAPSSYRAKVQR